MDNITPTEKSVNGSMNVSKYIDRFREPLSSQTVEELEVLAIDVAQGLVHAKFALADARGRSVAANLSSEDKRRVQLEFDTKMENGNLLWFENIQYILNRRIEILREGK